MFPRNINFVGETALFDTKREDENHIFQCISITQNTQVLMFPSKYTAVFAKINFELDANVLTLQGRHYYH